MTPLARMGRPEEIASAALFLAPKAATSPVSNLLDDGGLTAV
jgi:NAD(P)-dependent dehydrogenase (short-subunit alcohol dehydrogenase family)